MAADDAGELLVYLTIGQPCGQPVYFVLTLLVERLGGRARPDTVLPHLWPLLLPGTVAAAGSQSQLVLTGPAPAVVRLASAEERQSLPPMPRGASRMELAAGDASMTLWWQDDLGRGSLPSLFQTSADDLASLLRQAGQVSRFEAG